MDYDETGWHVSTDTTLRGASVAYTWDASDAIVAMSTTIAGSKTRVQYRRSAGIQLTFNSGVSALHETTVGRPGVVTGVDSAQRSCVVVLEPARG